jgi:hypothetical protein
MVVGVVMLGISLALALHNFSANTHLMLTLLRFMFPYMLVICVTAVLMGYRRQAWIEVTKMPPS